MTVPTRLTSTGNSCNRGNPAGDNSMSGARPFPSLPFGMGRGQGKVRRVKAELPEPQTWDLKPVALQQWLRWRRTTVAVTAVHRSTIQSRPPLPAREQRSNEAPSRTVSHDYGHHGIVSVGYLHRPTWRRSRHISQMPGVMPGTAATLRTVKVETNRETGTRMPADRVKDGASDRMIKP